jgi:hypothetical protein
MCNHNRCSKSTRDEADTYLCHTKNTEQLARCEYAAPLLGLLCVRAAKLYVLLHTTEKEREREGREREREREEREKRERRERRERDWGQT